MTAESLTDEIRVTRLAFAELRDRRPLAEIHEASYQRLSQTEEQLLVRLADRLERLYRFRNHMLAKAYSEGAGDWITPEDANNFSLPRHE